MSDKAPAPKQAPSPEYSKWQLIALALIIGIPSCVCAFQCRDSIFRIITGVINGEDDLYRDGGSRPVLNLDADQLAELTGMPGLNLTPI